MSKVFNPFAEEFLQNPYPAYAEMLEHKPVYFWDEEQKWVLLKYEDVKDLMRNKNFCPPGKYNKNNLPSWSSIFSKEKNTNVELSLQKAKFIVQDWLVLAEEEKHLLIRKQLMKCFATDELIKLEQHCETISNDILNQHTENIEIINEYAFQISMRVLLKVMGWEVEDIVLLKKHTTNILQNFKLNSSKKDEFLAYSSIVELAKIFTSVLQSNSNLQSGIILSLKELVEKNEITEDEFVGNCIFFLFAGQESSQLLIGNGIYLLHQNQKTLLALKEDHSLYDKAIKEILRYECPNPYFSRVALEDVVIRGQHIKKGEKIIGSINAANRDSEIFANPNNFDIFREDNRHISFGVGNHYCLGAHLAEIEGRVAIKNFFNHYKEYQLNGEVKWINNFRVRGIEKLAFDVR
jgi:cytochrome P450